jgi:hypothetical protein
VTAMQTAGWIVLAFAGADLVLLMLLLGTVWVAHRAVRREAAKKGEAVPSAASDFRCLFVALLVAFVPLAGAAVLLLTY